MSRATLRRIDLIEPIAVFSVIMAYIWELRSSHHSLWVLILAFIVASHIWRRESVARLGFHRANLRECVQKYGPMIAFIGLGMFAAGLVLQTTRPMALVDGFLAWTGYVAWGTFQQYLLNGYFLNRFAGAMPGRSAALTSAALFSGAHLPNWFLMIVTLVLGYAGTRIYMRYNNLYFLGLAHATLGFFLLLVVPDSVSHHMVVGPAWFTH